MASCVSRMPASPPAASNVSLRATASFNPPGNSRCNVFWANTASRIRPGSEGSMAFSASFLAEESVSRFARVFVTPGFSTRCVSALSEPSVSAPDSAPSVTSPVDSIGSIASLPTPASATAPAISGIYGLHNVQIFDSADEFASFFTDVDKASVHIRKQLHC